MEPYIYNSGVRVNPGVKIFKGYSTFPRSLGLEPQNWIQFSIIPKEHVLEGSYASTEDTAYSIPHWHNTNYTENGI